MPVPKFDQLLFPLLQFLNDGKEHALKEAIRAIEEELKLTEEEKAQMLPSGAQRTIVNRTGWARTFLKKAEFIESPRRGFMKITARGKEYLAKNPSTLTVDDLRQYPEYEENWHTDDNEASPTPSPSPPPELTPEERMDAAFSELRNDLAGNLLEQIAGLSPAFFERLVVDVLLKMGYGSSLKEAGKAIGRSGDGGIDGIINEDKLGLDVIYIQAKRWEGIVGRPEIQKFMGALAGNRARKGVFITTSSFTKDARDYVNSIDVKIVLVDGNQLAKLMIEHDVGVAQQEAYIVKKIDADYFTEE
jgi:restriction system protein